MCSCFDYQSPFFQGSGEQSQELYTFHEAVSQLQDAEDKLVDDHRKNIEVRVKHKSVIVARTNLNRFVKLSKPRHKQTS